jgi:heme/copper-type cytochrome/quinol oxidase subunit 3
VTRISTGKLAAAMFIASEAVFFTFLIAAYIYYRVNMQGPYYGKTELDPPRTLIFTICLLASSGTLWLAERNLAASHTPGFRLWLSITILLGAIFIGGQGWEYYGLITNNVTPERNLFGATFFTLTGFHGFHVVCGLISLIILLLLAFRKQFSEAEVVGMGAVSMYWHFVDVVWIVIFSIVYVAVWV